MNYSFIIIPGVHHLRVERLQDRLRAHLLRAVGRRLLRQLRPRHAPRGRPRPRLCLRRRRQPRHHRAPLPVAGLIERLNR